MFPAIGLHEDQDGSDKKKKSNVIKRYAPNPTQLNEKS
jgi:hypothetical protein